MLACVRSRYELQYNREVPQQGLELLRKEIKGRLSVLRVLIP